MGYYLSAGPGPSGVRRIDTDLSTLTELVPADVLAAAPASDPLGWLAAGKHLTTYQADKLRRGEGAALVVGPYRLLAPLARGGMGMVYLAADPAGGAVAVKILSPTRAAREPALRARFHREQHVGTKLPAHPHLVRQLDYGMGRGVEFLVLNHLPGRTVRQRLAVAPWSVGAACRVFADAAAGLHAAHTAGVIHRDLKPSNILVGPTGRGTVFDFGLALLVGEPADPKVVGGPRLTVGTLDYLPPEQAADAGRVGPPADIYALGGSLFVTLAGRLPFDAVGIPDKLHALRYELPPTLIQFRGDVPFALSELVRAMLGKHPGERPASMAEVAAELERFADKASGDPVPDRRPLAEVVAEAEAGFGASDRAVSVTLAAVPERVVQLTRWQAVGLAGGLVVLCAAAAVVGRFL